MRKGQNQTVADVVCGLYANRNKWTETVWTLEFKSGRVGFPKSFWESYSAFANTDGGIIVVGVDNEGNPEGIEKAALYREHFSNVLSSGTKCSEVLSGADDIAIVALDDKEVLAIRVQPASVAQKPVYLDGKPMNCYVRVGEGDRLCKADEVSRMLRDKDVVTRLHSFDLGRMLSHLREEGYLQSKGRSIATRYGLVDRLAKLVKTVGEEFPPVERQKKNLDSVVNTEKSSVVNSPISVVNEEKSSVVNDADSVVTRAEKMARELCLPSALCQALAVFRKKPRHHPEETDSMILSLCKGRYVSLTQMSVLLDRAAYTLRHNCLAPLIRHGRLTRLHAETTHKDQAYTTSATEEGTNTEK